MVSTLKSITKIIITHTYYHTSYPPPRLYFYMSSRGAKSCEGPVWGDCDHNFVGILAWVRTVVLSNILPAIIYLIINLVFITNIMYASIYFL